MITIDDFLVFCDRTIDGMRRAIGRCDDTTVNSQPPIPAPNSPFQLVTHALGATEWWTAHIVLGEPSNRVRDDEFTSAGTVAELQAALDAAQASLHELGPRLSEATTLAHPPETQRALGGPWTVGAALIHTYEELAQHLGHLEITVDLVA